jgi:sulfite reductase (NADPH) hemoprotein beta-component
MKALTANRLIDGEVVFLGEAGWVERFGEAVIFDDASEAAAEAAEAHAKTLITRLVEPYLIDVEEAGGGLAPVSYRERLRALGPTNKPDHGKQAAGGADIAALAGAHGAARSKGRINLIRRAGAAPG